MSGKRGIRRWFRLPPSEHTVGREIDDEIAFHLRARIAALEGAGVAAEEAVRQAEREFGDVSAARAELAAIDRVRVRRERRARWWDAVRWDIRLGLRALRRDPVFAAAVVVTLALGIGVNAAMFGITDRLLLSPPSHVADADEVVRVLYRQTPAWSAEPTLSSIVPYPDYTALRDGVPEFQSVAAYHSAYSVLGRGEASREVRVVFATASLFPTLGVRAALGRFYSAEEDAPPAGRRVVVLSHGFWREGFGGDPGVLGRTVEIDHETYEVIGVAPAGFAGVDLDPVHAWVPASVFGASNGGDDWHLSRNMHWLRLVARLASGAREEAASQRATIVFRTAYGERFDGDPAAGIVLGSVIAARAPMVGAQGPQRSGRIALWLLGVSVLVLVIACANVANLLLVRGMRRRRDVGVRMALGSGRGGIARQVFVETLVLVLAGAALGLVLAHWGGQVGRSLLLPDVEWAGSPVGGRVLVFAILIAGASALLTGVVPALHASRGDVAALLRLGGRSSHRRSGVQSSLVALQAMLSVVLLVGAGLFVRSLQRAAAIPLGFEADRVVSFRWHSTGLEWNRARVHALYQAGLERVRSLPQVEAAALTMTEPMWSALSASLRVPGLDSVPEPAGAGPYYSPVSTDYFRTMGARILRGRAFTNGDVPGSAPVVIATEALAELLWPGEDALGRCFVHLDADDDNVCRQVVGVVEDTRYSSVEGEPTPMFFSPMAQEPGRAWRALLVRLRGTSEDGIPAVRRALVNLEPGLPHVRATLLSTRVDPYLQPWRLGATLFTAFGALALLLSAVGLYGVIAYDVALRRRELGVRVAFGARASMLVRMVLGDATRILVLGLIAGLAAAGWAAAYIEPLLFGVSPRDPAVLAAVTALLLVIGIAAAALPAWRAAHVQPTEALRDE